MTELTGTFRFSAEFNFLQWRELISIYFGFYFPNKNNLPWLLLNGYSDPFCAAWCVLKHTQAYPVYKVYFLGHPAGIESRPSAPKVHLSTA